MSSAAAQKIRLLLTGGGTGGHLFPAIATAQRFQQSCPVEVLFIGTSRKLDSESLARYGFAAQTITSAGIKGKGPLQLLTALCSLPLGYVQALAILRKFRPHIVLGVGGYVTGPVIVAARTLGIPVVLHEQNSVAGLANRKLGIFAQKICLSLPGSEAFFPPEKVVFTGNPVRDLFLQQGKRDAVEDSGKKTVLVLGGSQGAHALNLLLPQIITRLQHDIKVIHQCGKKDVDAVCQAYMDGGVTAVVEPFFTDMAEVYAQADLVVSRAGATTLAELAVLGKPAVLIPYPYAADNHQKINGDYYVKGGAALMFEESQLDVDILLDAVAGLLEDSSRLQQMSAAMKKLAFFDAAEQIVAVCRQIAHRDDGDESNV